MSKESSLLILWSICNIAVYILNLIRERRLDARMKQLDEYEQRLIAEKKQ